MNLSSAQQAARLARNVMIVLLVAFTIGILTSRPRVELPGSRLPTGPSVAVIRANPFGLFFRQQWRVSFDAGREFDVLLKSKVGQLRVDSAETALLPVYWRDLVTIRVDGPAGGSVAIRDGGLQRTLLPGGWLVLALLLLGAVWCHRLRHGRREQFLGAAVLAGASVITVVLAGVALQAVSRFSPRHQQPWHLFPPLMDDTRYIYPGITPGIPEGVVHFKTSSDGLRARERDDRYDRSLSVLCLGASTTEGLLLGENDHWPHVLETLLAERSGTDVWVGNAGRSGYTSDSLVTVAANYLPRLRPKVLVVLTMPAIELAGAVAEPPSVASDQRILSWASDRLDRIVLTRLLRRTLLQHRSRSPHDVEQRNDNTYLIQARNRLAALARSEPPRERNWDAVDLSGFERDLRQLYALAQSAGARLILCTQPALYRADLRPDEARLLWLGGNDSVASKRRQVDVVNHRIRRVAADLGVTLVDLDRDLPRTTEVFYDDFHFNVGGARMTADLVARAILPPATTASAR